MQGTVALSRLCHFALSQFQLCQLPLHQFIPNLKSDPSTTEVPYVSQTREEIDYSPVHCWCCIQLSYVALYDTNLYSNFHLYSIAVWMCSHLSTSCQRHLILYCSTRMLTKQELTKWELRNWQIGSLQSGPVMQELQWPLVGSSHARIATGTVASDWVQPCKTTTTGTVASGWVQPCATPQLYSYIQVQWPVVGSSRARPLLQV